MSESAQQAIDEVRRRLREIGMDSLLHVVISLSNALRVARLVRTGVNRNRRVSLPLTASHGPLDDINPGSGSSSKWCTRTPRSSGSYAAAKASFREPGSLPDQTALCAAST